MFGFLIAVGAGFLIPHLLDPVARPIVAQLRRVMTIAEAEIATIAALVAVIAAAFVASIFDSGSALGIGIGVFVGYFATRIFAAANKKGR